MSTDAKQKSLAAAHRSREAVQRQWDKARNPDLMRLAVLATPKLLGADRCGVFVATPDRAFVWLEAGTGMVERQIEVAADYSMVGEVLRSGEALMRSASDGETLSKTGYPVTTALTVPIRRVDGSEVVGALQVLNREDGEPFDDDDVAALTDVAFTMQASVERLYDAQALLDTARALDLRIEQLDAEESSLRGDNLLRTFEPSLTEPDGTWLHHQWQGKRYPPFIHRESTAALCETWDTEPEDVFIATHQKTGTHLTKKFVLEVMRALFEYPDAHPYHSGDIGHRTVPWPEVLLSQHGRVAWHDFRARTAGGPRLWYLHNAIEDMPARRVHPRSRFIVTVRDPRGTAVSQYHFWRRHPLLRPPQPYTMDAFIERFVDGSMYFGDYHQHVLGWVRRFEPYLRAEQILVLRYEELVEDKAAAVERIVRFLAPGRTLSPERRDAIVASTGFQAMKREMSDNPRSFHFNPNVFFRSGKARGWEEQLSAEHVAKIDAKTRRLWGGASLVSPPEALG